MNNTFTFKKLLNNNWINLTGVLFGSGDETTLSMMKRFSGMVFNKLGSGLQVLRPSEIQLPNGSTATLNIGFSTSVAIETPIRICVGFIMLPENNALSGDGEYQVETSINDGGKVSGHFACSFSITNGIVTDYTWSNQVPLSDKLLVRILQFEAQAKCFPVIFAIEDSVNFNNSYIIDELNNKYMQEYGLPAQWVKSVVNSENCVKSTYNVVYGFKTPEETYALSGANITLPDYESVYNNLYNPYGWSIDGVEYPLGSTYTMPKYDVIANLLYYNNYSGMVIL